MNTNLTPSPAMMPARRFTPEEVGRAYLKDHKATPKTARPKKKTNTPRSSAAPLGLTQRIGNLFPELKALSL